MARLRSDVKRSRKARRRKLFPIKQTYMSVDLGRHYRDLRGQRRSTLKARFADKHQGGYGGVHPIKWSSLNHADCLVLHAPLRREDRLDLIIEAAICRGIKHVAVVGPDEVGIEHMIDLIVIKDGNDPDRFMATTSHASMRDALRTCGRGCGVVRLCYMLV